MRSNAVKQAETTRVDPTSECSDEPALPASQLDWQSVDRALRSLALHRAKLDAEEAWWLRAAEALQIWRQVGMVSALDYLERVMGYSPRAGQERLRVARALGALPELTSALEGGVLMYSAVRELSRVVTPATEAEWIASARGKNLRQIEDMVSGHCPGARPDDPADPDVRTRVVRLELSAETFALFRQAHGALNEEHGRHLDDDELMNALCSAALDGEPGSEPTGRARHQIAVLVCSRCKQGWQDSAGVRVSLPAEAVERAMCDAQYIGSLDGDAPERASQGIPPSVVRFVWRRDGGRCRVPGCRSTRGLEVHHLVHRADGGGHDPKNLVLACSSCHLAHHRGVLTISGTADRLDVRRPSVTDEHTHGGAPAPQRDGFEREAAASTAIATSVPDAPSRLALAIQRVARKQTPEQQFGVANAYPHGDSHAWRRHRAQRDARSSASAARTREGPNELMAVMSGEECERALVGLGWKSPIARAATTAALDSLGARAPLERLIAEALRRCPRPRS